MIHLVMYPSSTQEYQDMEAQELPFANAINSYWAPIPNLEHHRLSHQPKRLSTLRSGHNNPCLTHTLLSILGSRKEKLSLLNLYLKLSTQDQLIIKAVTNAQENRTSTTQAITIEFQKLSSTPTSDAFRHRKAK